MTFYLVKHWYNSLLVTPKLANDFLSSQIWYNSLQSLFLMTLYIVKHRYNSLQLHPNFQIQKTSQNSSHSNHPTSNRNLKMFLRYSNSHNITSFQRVESLFKARTTQYWRSSYCSKKRHQKCTQHPLFDFLSLNQLSTEHKNLLTTIDPIILSKTVHGTSHGRADECTTEKGDMGDCASP